MKDLNASLDKLTKSIPMRARVALVLWIAESVLEDLKSDPHGLSLATEALQASWDWEEGENISGDILNNYIDNPDEEKSLGMKELDYEDNSSMKASIISITMAVIYTARCAYFQEGVQHMPATIESIDEDNIPDILNWASQSKYFNSDLIGQIMFFLDNTTSETFSEFGKIIKRGDFIKHRDLSH